MTNTELKNNIDTQITNQSIPGQTTHGNVGSRMKDVIDYIDQEIENIPSSTGTLQEVVTAGNNFVVGNFKTTITGQVKTENTSTQQVLLIQPTNAQFTKNSSGLKTTTLQQADTPTANRLVKLPDEDGTLAIQKYKSYVALISQSGTSAPTAIVLENSLDATISFSYSGVGSYLINASADVFTDNKTGVITSIHSSFTAGQMKYDMFTAAIISLTSFNGNTSTNGILDKAYIEIRVYN